LPAWLFSAFVPAATAPLLSGKAGKKSAPKKKEKVEEPVADVELEGEVFASSDEGEDAEVLEHVDMALDDEAVERIKSKIQAAKARLFSANIALAECVVW
jgi:hypothetical protein